MDPEKIVGEVQNLISFPDAFLRANELLDSPNSSAEEIGEVINLDPALSARLLKLVNSAFFSLSAQVDTISRAITLIGTDELRSLIMATAVAQAFENVPSDMIDMEKFWHRSVYCGLVAKELAALGQVGHGESMFLIGLLHDVGHLALYASLPDEIQKIIESAAESEQNLAELEMQALGFDAAELGSILLENWQLPRKLWEPIRCQHKPEMAQEFSSEAKILHSALMLTDRVEPELKIDTPQGLEKLESINLNGTTVSGKELARVATIANFACFEILAIINPRAMMIY